MKPTTLALVAGLVLAPQFPAVAADHGQGGALSVSALQSGR